MEARNRRLSDWLARVRTRQIVLPRFQRYEAWGHQETTSLLETVVRGLPAGALLTLEVGDTIPFVCRPIVGAPDQGERITELLLDGQQRLTALWRSLTNDHQDRTFFVRIPDGVWAFEDVEIVSWARYIKNGQRYPLWAESPAHTWERRLVPISLLYPTDNNSASVTQWAGQATENDAMRTMELALQIQRLQQRFSEFNLPFLALPVGTKREVALDVFVKMNTSLVRLSTFDIIVAQLEAETGQSLHDLVQEILQEMPHLSDYHNSPGDLVLSIAALRQNRVPNQTGHLDMDLNQMVVDWSQIKRGIQGGLQFLADERVFDLTRLPTEIVLPPLMALWSLMPSVPDAAGNGRVALRKYLWRSFFTDRYERAAATAALQDFRALRDLLSGTGDESAIPCFNDKLHPLPEIEALIQAGWPRRRDRLARAVLLLSLHGGALDIADGTPVSFSHLKQREYHHLFPVAYLADKSYSEAEASRALNCALITWRTNRTISAKEPMTYLKERVDGSSLGKDEIQSRLLTHLISFDDLANLTFEEFLAKRATKINEAMRVVCNGAIL